MALNIALNTLAFHGYPWRTALAETARLGVQFIEPVYITKYDPSLQESSFTEVNARTLSRQIEDAGLKTRSVASHMDMGLIDTTAIFQKRMEFVKALGAEVIIT